MLERLGDETRRAIAARWAIRDFRPEEIIVSQGSRSMGLWFVIEGFVRVERQHGERPVVLTFLQPDDVFGEMSWLEEEGASAAVVAEAGGAKVALLRDQALDDLAAEVPAASIEIHRALATLLARRLRATSARIRRSQSFEDATRTTSPPTPGRGNGRARTAPAPAAPPSGSVAGAAPADKPDWTSRARELAGRFRAVRAVPRSRPEEAAARLVPLLDEAVALLGQAALAADSVDPGSALHVASDTLFPDLLPFLVLSPALSRLQMVPADQRHPAVFDQVLVRADARSSADPMGAALDRWAAELPTCRALRARRDAVATWLDQHLTSGGPSSPPQAIRRPRCRLALVGGGAVDALDLLLASTPEAVRWWQVAVIGPDPTPFRRLETRLEGGRLAAALLFIEADPFSGDLDARLLPQHLVVSSGPADFSDDAALSRGLEWMAAQLDSDDGELVLASLTTDLPDLAFIRSVLGWPIRGYQTGEIRPGRAAAAPPGDPRLAGAGFHLHVLRTPGDAALA